MKAFGLLVAAALGFVAGLLLRGPQRLAPPSSAYGAAHESTATEPAREAVLETVPPFGRSPVPVSAAEIPQVPDEPPTLSGKPTLRDALDILNEAVLPGGGSSSEDSFREKYSGLSLNEMRIAEFALKAKVQEETDRISAELFSQGRFETKIVPEGQQALMPQATPTEPVVSIGFQVVPDEGFSTVNVARIVPEEYPEFDSLRHEWRWLASYLKRQESQPHDDH